MLSEKQLTDYQRDGFLVIKSFYDDKTMAIVDTAVDQLSHRERKPGAEMAYYEDSLLHKGERVLSRIEFFADNTPALNDIIYGQKMISCVKSLLKDDVYLFKEKINFKLPGGGGFLPHQDIQPGWDQYAPYFISVLVTIDESTHANGCLELCAGQHKRGWIGRPWKPLEGDELKGLEFVKYPMSPGDVAFFDCYVPHQSAANVTDKKRRNLYLTYNRKSDGDHRLKYFSDKRMSFPPDNEREPGKVYQFKV